MLPVVHYFCSNNCHEHGGALDDVHGSSRGNRGVEMAHHGGALDDAVHCRHAMEGAGRRCLIEEGGRA